MAPNEMGSFRAGQTRWLILGASWGVVAAVIVSGDPFVSHSFGIPFLGGFPFQATLSTFVFLGLVAILAGKRRKLWSDPDLVCITTLIFASQFIGVRFGLVDTLDVATAALLLFWLLRVLSHPSQPIYVNHLTLVMILGLVFLMFLSAVNEPFPRFVIGFGAMALRLGCFFLAMQFVTRRSSITKVVRVFIAAAVFSAVAAIVQVAIYEATGTAHTLIVAEKFVFKPLFGLGLKLRASAFSPNPQQLSNYILLALPFVLFGMSMPGVGRKKRMILLVLAAILCWANVLVLSLGAWFIMAMLMGLFVYLRWPSRTIHITVAAAIGVVAVYQVGLIEDVYAELGESVFATTASDRVELIFLAVEKLQRSPYVGEGFRNFAYYSGNVDLWPVHNAYLQAATELGIFGGLLFLLLCIWLLLRLFLLAIDLESLEDRLLVKAFLLGMVGLVANAMYEPSFDGAYTWLYFGLVEAVLLTFGRESSRRTLPRRIA